MSAEASLPPLAARERLVDDSISAAQAIAGTDGRLPERAQVVAVDGGIIGASVRTT
jgi:hypothetical protein